MMDVWIETFHPFTSILVIWDVHTHLDILKDCGLIVDEVECYDNKAITIELSSPLEAYELLDKIESQGYSPVMEVYDQGRKLSDNIEP